MMSNYTIRLESGTKWVGTKETTNLDRTFDTLEEARQFIDYEYDDGDYDIRVAELTGAYVEYIIITPEGEEEGRY